MTGVISLNVELVPKQLELLHELVPTATVMALVVNPASPARAESNTREAQVAARRLGLKLHVLHAGSEQDFDAALANASTAGRGAQRRKLIARLGRNMALGIDRPCETGRFPLRPQNPTSGR